MSTRKLVVSAITGICLLAAAAAPARADVCITVDETRDTFSPQERSAALLLLTRQFERAGERIVPPGCNTPYVVSHVQLGASITVTLTGPAGEREAVALGMEDVPAVYSQMVRSLVTGLPMTAHGVLDRTNVSEAQAVPPRRVESDSVLYARLGYGAIFGDRTYGGPSIGLIGYRKELDSFAIDVSFLNFQHNTSRYAFGYASGGMTGSWLKLEGLRFKTPLSDRSFYYGGGLSWSSTNLNNGSEFWDGSGLQGELTAGYELGRASTIRVFVQADAGLPFYTVSSTSYFYSYNPRSPYPTATTTDRRYAPSMMVSLGLGWQRGGRR